MFVPMHARTNSNTTHVTFKDQYHGFMHVIFNCLVTKQYHESKELGTVNLKEPE